MTVQFAVELPTSRADRPDAFVSGDAVAEIARAAEDAGYAACFVTDHPAGDAGWLDSGGHHALDPFVALSFAAAATSTLRLLTYVYIAAYRNPFLTAKSMLSLDVLSGGRLILGTGAGYLRPEFGALGVDFDERNELLDEVLDVLDKLWSGGDVAHDGRHFRARGVRMQPASVAQPHPPIWMGGNSKLAIRRAVERCEGWAPFASAGIERAVKTATIGGLEDLAARIDYAKQHSAEVGRVRRLDICFSAGVAGDASVDLALRREHVRQLDALGVTWLTVGFSAGDRPTYIERLRRFAADIITA